MFIGMFGGFKGIRPDRSWQQLTIVCCGIAAWFCLAGYFGGFFDRTPGRSLGAPGTALEWHPFQWDAETIAYTAGLWLSWGVGIWLTPYYSSTQTRWGMRIMLSLPILLFLIFAFELIELGPK